MSSRVAEVWLRAACWITIAVGLLSLAGSHPASGEPWRLFFDLVQWPIDGNPGVFNQSERLMNGMVGGLMIGWAGLMLALVRRPAPPYDSMLLGLGLWFVVDSAGSVLAGVWGNVAVNAAFLLLFLPPIVRLRAR